MLAVPPPASGATLAIGTAFLVADDTASPLVSRPELAAASDPLVLKDGGRLLPPTASEFEAGGSLSLVFWLAGVPMADGKPKLDLSLAIQNAEGKLIEAPSRLALFAPEPAGGFRAMAVFDVRALAPGGYAVHVDAQPGVDGSSTRARRVVPFTIRAREESSASAAAVESTVSTP
jgi:hypothetical protein